MKPASLTSLVLVLLLLCGCSGWRSYPNTLEKNLTIHTTTDSNFFSSVTPAVDIYDVDADCRPDYLGSVTLRESEVEIGIPTDRTSYLVFVFASSSCLGNASSSISYDTLLRPRAGYNYDVAVSYKRNMYNVVIWEGRAGRGGRREIEARALNACGDYLHK